MSLEMANKISWNLVILQGWNSSLGVLDCIILGKQVITVAADAMVPCIARSLAAISVWNPVKKSCRSSCLESQIVNMKLKKCQQKVSGPPPRLSVSDWRTCGNFQHCQQWYWLCRMNRSLSFMSMDFIYLCHLSGEKWGKMQMYFYASSNNSTHKELWCICSPTDDGAPFCVCRVWTWYSGKQDNTWSTSRNGKEPSTCSWNCLITSPSYSNGVPQM